MVVFLAPLFKLICAPSSLYRGIQFTVLILFNCEMCTMKNKIPTIVDKPKKKLLNICSGALNAKYGLKAGHALNTINSLKAGGRSECQIWVESGGGHAFNTIYSLKAGGGAL